MKMQVKKSGYSANDLSEMIKSLAHPHRIQILDLIYNSDLSKLTVNGISEKLKLEQPIVSRHLGIMRRAGLLIKKTEGRNSYYTLNSKNLVCNCMKQILVS